MFNFTDLHALAVELDLALRHTAETLNSAIRKHSRLVSGLVDTPELSLDERGGILFWSVQISRCQLVSADSQLSNLTDWGNFERQRVGLIGWCLDHKSGYSIKRNTNAAR